MGWRDSGKRKKILTRWRGWWSLSASRLNLGSYGRPRMTEELKEMVFPRKSQTEWAVIKLQRMRAECLRTKALYSLLVQKIYRGYFRSNFVSEGLRENLPGL
ncbi:hypothetical protein NBRC116597_09150 [Phaeobacter sp. NW0010-22]